jgi:hypothetical protein
MKILQVGLYSIKILTNGSAPRCSPNTQFHDLDSYVKTGRRQRWGNILVGQQTYPSKVEGVEFEEAIDVVIIGGVDGVNLDLKVQTRYFVHICHLLFYLKT